MSVSPDDKRWADGILRGRIFAGNAEWTGVGGWILGGWTAAAAWSVLGPNPASAVALAVAGVLTFPAATAFLTRLMRTQELRVALHDFPLAPGRSMRATLLSGTPLPTAGHCTVTVRVTANVVNEGGEIERVSRETTGSVSLSEVADIFHPLGRSAVPFTVEVPPVPDLGHAGGDVEGSSSSSVTARARATEGKSPRPLPPRIKAEPVWKLTIVLPEGRVSTTVEFRLPVVGHASELRWAKDPRIDELPRPARLSAEGHRLCPRCGKGGLLEGEGVAGGRGCPACGGVFLSEAHTDDVLVRLGLDKSMARELINEMSKRGLDCVECGQPMAALPLKGVQVDLCKGCGGLWLDAGELARLDAR